VKTLVELHHGTVTVMSGGAGQGSTFELRLPVMPAQPQPDLQKEAVLQDGSGSRRVLIVDDNEDAAELLTMMLELDGHVVEKIHHGAGAIEVARRFQPEIVFLDIGLPDMSGYEVARRLRELPGTVGAVLIALTGYGQQKDRDEALNAGFNHHLVKPVSFDALMLAVRNKLDVKYDGAFLRTWLWPAASPSCPNHIDIVLCKNNFQSVYYRGIPV
jgi:CheY-like chemotaxis protein